MFPKKVQPYITTIFQVDNELANY